MAIRRLRIGRDFITMKVTNFVHPEKEFLNKKELATLLGLSVHTIDAWVSQKREIPYIKSGRRVLFDRRDIDAYLDRNKVHPVSITS
jgi:excisionase family DNA binding protein